jgi:hypothetical protein
MMIITKLILLFAGHALADYPLQGDFLARGKNQIAPLPGVPWYQCLFAHALIHAGVVLAITQSVWLALAEFTIHAITDYAKCAGWFGTGEKAFNIDQTIHYACKVLWAVL